MLKKNIIKLFLSTLLLVFLLNVFTSPVKAAEATGGGGGGGGTHGTFKDVFTYTFFHTAPSDSFFIKSSKVTLNIITYPISVIRNFVWYGYGTISGNGWYY
ncbi:hypothetical protein NEAUS04_0986 [Nematocida ausubeli]|uniref:Uncharacterized protein n=1 Tax=Nematocida ausubeli (strain ATCC PRA-371 / ERTm2) TaxID=1913371 RepID=H8ZCA8_NEMA1|nr:uncharacterized protein NESG_02177 [Nematocida ausubeli]EHY65744.1 hypothetical protein NERG_01351 [Nematocida ausubeli]KAI5135242.1 hypothetical protein NEAUS07_1078 [Nematocida ausubeli]KAI5135406.1 hypothetical protein NEAUS06_1473 [Nematocida ausubeli]KAI5148048.1 hypothetical protein NEAUS05_1254 [Nematocida ausubeli]KAI5162267.1 hypothetical protein NEAUS04_0986 [Nematocida ausubeli]